MQAQDFVPDGAGLFELADGNGDDEIDQAELTGWLEGMFDGLDANQDGVLQPGEMPDTAIEVSQSKDDWMGGMIAVTSRLFDSNGDGRITRADNIGSDAGE